MTELYRTVIGIGATVYFTIEDELIGVIRYLNGELFTFRERLDELEKNYMKKKELLTDKDDYRKVIKLTLEAKE